MRQRAMCCLLSMAFAIGTASAAPPLALYISRSANTAKIGADVTLNVKCTNISTAKKTLFTREALASFGDHSLDNKGNGHAEAWNKVIVRYDNGNPVPLTTEGENQYGSPPKNVRPRRHSVGAIYEMAPWENFSDTVALNRLFDLSEPGKYTVQLEHSMVIEPWETYGQAGETIKSNVLTFTITSQNAAGQSGIQTR